MNYTLKGAGAQPDPNLETFTATAGTFKVLAESPKGVAIVNRLTSVAGVNRLIGSVAAAPSRPPVAAVEHLLTDAVGPSGFDDETKRFIGRIIRQIIEALGGAWVRSGVRINIDGSAFSKGSIYRF
ncbi:MAG: hypothetical protein ACXW3D_02475 [Caulobacteraceae bacterium]